MHTSRCRRLQRRKIEIGIQIIFEVCAIKAYLLQQSCLDRELVKAILGTAFHRRRFVVE